MKNKIPLIAVLPILLSACSSSPDEGLVTKNQGIQVLYDDAKYTLRQGNFAVASQKLSSIDSRFPFGPLSHQVQLDLIYSHYKSGQTDQALASIDRFMRLNPNHSDVDYAMYMRGLVNMDTDKNLFQQIVGIDRSDRDPFKAREAFEDFRNLIEKYPESKYAADASKRMSFIKNRLAKYELKIARFYVKRGAYVAAANRGQHVVEHYSDSQHLEEALQIMVKCYEKLELDTLKANAEKTLALNFPQNS